MRAWMKRLSIFVANEFHAIMILKKKDYQLDELQI